MLGSSLVLLSYNLQFLGFFENFQRTCNRSYERTGKESMDQGRFFDQFFGIVFGTMVVVSQDWFFWIFWESVFLLTYLQFSVIKWAKGPFTLFMTPLPAEDSFFWVSVLPKRFQKTMLLSVCLCVCVFPKFSCIPQAVPNSTTLHHVSFLSQNSRLVTYIGRPKRRCYIIFYFVSI